MTRYVSYKPITAGLQYLFYPGSRVARGVFFLLSIRKNKLKTNVRNHRNAKLLTKKTRFQVVMDPII